MGVLDFVIEVLENNMEITKNVWFVGIVTGIISGVLVFFITNWIMKKKGKEDYLKQVGSANQNVILALKPYISERGLPDVEIFKALIDSVARNYSIEAHDMYTVSEFCEELIREIISDIYVSSDKKKEYTDSLIAYKKNIDKSGSLEKIEGKRNMVDSSAKFRKRTTAYMSLMISIMTMVLTIVIALSSVTDINEYHSVWYPFDENPMLWLPIFMIVIVLIMMVAWQMADILVRRVKNGKKNMEGSDENN